MTGKRIKIFGLILVALPLVLGACSAKDQQSESNWQDEILMAQSCGSDGLMCCPDKEPQCQFGQACCVDPHDEQRNYCADECNFGTEGSFCRLEGEPCDSGLVCDQGNCLSCGGENEPCCASGDSCSDALICARDLCLRCGLPGNPCCDTEPSCSTDPEDSSRIECRNDICTFCGAAGGAACDLSPACDAWHLLNNAACLACGGYNQPCCQTADEPACKSADLMCRVGFCAKK